MIKNNFEQLSDLEFKILKELQKNCRINLDEVGKKCGCSRFKVKRVMKKLEENKAIIGYSVVVDPNKINLKYYTLLVKRTSEPLAENIAKYVAMGSFADVLPEIDVEIVDTIYVNGYYDFIVTFRTDNITRAKELYNRIIEAYSKYIEKVELLEMVIPFRLGGIRIYQPEMAKVL